MVAADRDTLPCYSILSNGVASVTDTGIAGATTLWGFKPAFFKSQAFGLTGMHAPQAQWNFDPMADYTQLEAIRSACRWVLDGPEHMDARSIHMLTDPETDLSPGPHFGVIERLRRLPLKWLCCGSHDNVPNEACFSEDFGDKWLWVMPEGMEGLAEFTLVLQDIATLDVAPSDAAVRPANLTPPLIVTIWVEQVIPKPLGDSSQKDTVLAFRVDRVIRPECKAIIESRIAQMRHSNDPVRISWAEWMEWTTPYQGQPTAAKPGAPSAAPSCATGVSCNSATDFTARILTSIHGYKRTTSAGFGPSRGPSNTTGAIISASAHASCASAGGI